MTWRKREIEAMKLALEALENHCGNYKLDDAGCDRHEKATTALKEALAQPEQEPVATIDSIEQEIYENTREFVSLNVMEWLLNRLNIPPQRTWVGLTFAEICECENDYLHLFARAIEAKLRSKNEHRG